MGQFKKVLFLVYRVGWWGCFDELYREHKADPGCQCSVVVLPRYDRDPESHEIIFDRYQYDGDAMPRDVEVTDFRGYSLAGERPDVVYIHNIYDNSSIMDSVPIEYYSWNVKQFTPRLVYVHHKLGFTAQDLKYRVFYYVDRVYVHRDREKYGFPAELDGKLETVPSGIVPYLRRQWQQRPAPRGETPVTVFLAVGYDDLFYGTDRALGKLEQVLGLFKGRRDYRVILHSDRELQDHFHELQGNVANEYIRIINRFVEKKIGAYDISYSDCEAALNADIYMSLGWKPVMNCFSVLGKPCFVLAQEKRPLPTADDLCIPGFWDCAVEGDEVTFVADVLKLLCRMNLKTGKLSILGEVPDEIDGGANYIGVQKKGDTCYLVPYSSDGLVIFDEKSGRGEKKYLPGVPSPGNFTQAVPYGQYLFLIPRFFKGILRYDTESGEFRVYDGWVRELEQAAEAKDQGQPYFVRGIRQEANVLHMASSKAAVILHFDMETGEHRLEDTGIPGGRFFDMEIQGEDTVLLPFMGGRVYARHGEKGSWDEIYDYPTDANCVHPFDRCVYSGGKWVMFPMQAGCALSWDGPGERARERKDLVCCGKEAYLSEYLRDRKVGYQAVKRLENGNILLYEQYTGSFHLLDGRLHAIKRIKCRLPYDEVMACYKRVCDRIRIRGQCYYGVQEWQPLPVMLEYLKDVCRDGEYLRENVRRYMELNYCKK